MRRSIRRVADRVMTNAGLTLIPTWRLEHRPAALHLGKVFDAYGVDAVFDIGANEGKFGLFLRRELGYSGWIFSYEPAPEPLVALRRRASLDSKWEVFDKALGATAGVQDLHIARHSTLSSFLRPRFDQTKFAYNSRQTSQTISVPVTSLDQAFLDIRSRVPIKRPFLKLDTQGYDMEVVWGGEEAMRSAVALQIELSIVPLYENTPTYAQTIQHLMQRGFRLSDFFAVARDSNLQLLEMDCIMVKAASAIPRGN